MKSKLLESIASIEKAIKKRNPNARLNWRRDYHLALETAQTPRDYEIIHNMSFFEFCEYVLHLEGARYRSARSQGEQRSTPAAQALALPPVMDEIDRRILEIVTDDPDLTDSQVGAKIGLTRGAVNPRRRALGKAGHRVR